MGILEGVFETPAAKKVADTLAAAGTMVYDGAAAVGNAAYNVAAATAHGAAYAAGTAKNLAVNSTEFAVNATVNTVTQPAVTAQAVKDAVQHPYDQAKAAYGEFRGTEDPKAKRAHQVVTARQLVKAGITDEAAWAGIDADVHEQVLAEVVHPGRRKDIQADFDKRTAEWQAKEGEKGDAPKPPLVVKLSIGGSGDAAWRTHCNIKGVLTDEGLKATKQQAGAAKTVYYTGEREHNWNFAGPGGPGSGSLAGGGSDTGPNSIENLVLNATGVVAQAVTDALNNEQDRPITILIKGHSRGAVAAGRIANELKQRFPAASIELTQVDPVPGPAQADVNQKIDVGGIDESTVIYGVYSGHGFSFTPMQVLGAKRIIISQQAHGVGVQNGFRWDGAIYKGSSLNSLPAGVYRDQNADISVVGDLESIGTVADIRQTFVAVYAKKYADKVGALEGKAGQEWDAERKERIEAALEQYAAKLSPAESADLIEEVMVDHYADTVD